MTAFCLVIMAINFINYSFLTPPGFPESLLVPSVWNMPVFGILLYVLTTPNHWSARMLQALLMLIMAGPVMYANGVGSFFGYWLVVFGVVLLYKYGFLKRGFVWKTLACMAWTVVWIYITAERSPYAGFVTTLGHLLYMVMVLACLYSLFEEEIRDLLAANKQKDAELAEKEATIARLEPLSVLGERVAHVTHSFKNNLSQVGMVLYYLEEMKDPVKAAEKIHQFSAAMNERIDNILMVSRAGSDRNLEVFDASRVLAGLNQVYLTEPTFLNLAKVELDASEPTLVEAIRWDFLMMSENILKNALEALSLKGGYGAIRITLKDHLLTLANNGGAMPLCSTCEDSCLDCSRYGHPGQTTKKAGSGHGLAQVFATCRKYGWTLRIRTEDDWTRFEIGLGRVPARPRALVDAPTQTT